MSFLKEFISNPSMVWTCLPCFSSLVNNVLNNVDFNQDLKIVEYWPWKWNFLKPILNKASDSSEIISLELNDWFFGYCKDEFNDSRLSLFNDSAENVSNYVESNVDVIISWVPLSALDKDSRYNILKASRNILKEWWIYLQYQYFSSAMNDIKEIFPNVKKNRVFNHLPPAVYYLAKK